jgi:hypothetical protein
MDLTAQARRIGEVIEASTGEFSAQCYQLNQAPPLGSLVKVRSMPLEIYAVVYNIENHSLELGRRPIARGEHEETEEGIFQTNPQLSKLLCTDFNALVLGHRQAGDIAHWLPAKPAYIHSFAYICSSDEVRDFTQCLDFLSLLIAADLCTPVDEVIAACLRYSSHAHHDPHAFLVGAGKELAALLSGDLRRLNSILRKLQ